MCISTEEEPTEISWLYSNEGEDNLTVISTTDDTFLVLDNMTYNQSGLYMCEGGNVISTLVSVAVGSKRMPEGKERGRRKEKVTANK